MLLCIYLNGPCCQQPSRVGRASGPAPGPGRDTPGSSPRACTPGPDETARPRRSTSGSRPGPPGPRARRPACAGSRWRSAPGSERALLEPCEHAIAVGLAGPPSPPLRQRAAGRPAVPLIAARRLERPAAALTRPPRHALIRFCGPIVYGRDVRHGRSPPRGQRAALCDRVVSGGRSTRRRRRTRGVVAAAPPTPLRRQPSAPPRVRPRGVQATWYPA